MSEDDNTRVTGRLARQQVPPDLIGDTARLDERVALMCLQIQHLDGRLAHTTWRTENVFLVDDLPGDEARVAAGLGHAVSLP